MKNYCKMVCFYGCDLLGAFFNCVGAVFGYYPGYDFGVNFLLFIESHRIESEKSKRATLRSEKEGQAQTLKEEAKANG